MPKGNKIGDDIQGYRSSLAVNATIWLSLEHEEDKHSCLLTRNKNMEEELASFASVNSPWVPQGAAASRAVSVFASHRRELKN